MANYIALTKEKLGPLFKKPTLKDKFLKKPPFRFIHDCCSAIKNNTGFLDGVWSGEMLNGKDPCFKKSDIKAQFLKSLICAVEVTLLIKLSVKPNKIIKGEEPKKTNELFQALADAAVLVKSGSINMEDVLAWMQNPESRFSQQQKPEDVPATKENPPQPQIIEEKSQPISDAVSEPTPPQIDPKYANPKQEPVYSDIVYIKETQLILQNIFAKPPLKEKLLKRPPIRFLLDVVKAIKKETEFFDTIPDSMLVGKKFKAMKGDAKKKFQKQFINRIIKYIESHNGPKIQATSKSIAQGNNAEATNKMLQIIGKMATGQYIPEKSETTIATPPPKEQQTQQEKEIVEEKPKPVAEPLQEEPIKKKAQNEKKEMKTNSTKPKRYSKNKKESKEKSSKKKLKPSTNEKVKSETIVHTKKSEDPIITVQPASTSNDALPPRPPTKERGDSSGNHLTVARQGPPRPHSQKGRTSDRSRSRTPNMIITDGVVEEEVVEEEEHFPPVSGVEFNIKSKDELLGGAENQGKLVREIMGQNCQEMPISTTTNITIDSNKQEEQINHLRDDIQSICTSVIPLGKCLDFVFEDIELIKQEFKKYKAAHDKNKRQLGEEKEQTELTLQPLTLTLKQRISERDQLIKQINEKKAAVAQNQMKMEKQLCKMIGLEN